MEGEVKPSIEIEEGQRRVGYICTQPKISARSIMLRQGGHELRNGLIQIWGVGGCVGIRTPFRGVL